MVMIRSGHVLDYFRVPVPVVSLFSFVSKKFVVMDIVPRGLIRWLEKTYALKGSQDIFDRTVRRSVTSVRRAVVPELMSSGRPAHN